MVSQRIFLKYITHLVEEDDLYTVEISEDELHFIAINKGDSHTLTIKNISNKIKLNSEYGIFGRYEKS